MVDTIEPPMSLLKTYILDSDQHLERYKIIRQQAAQEIFPLIWELKLFVDLMMAYECMLKSIYCNTYNIQSPTDMKKTHNINILYQDIKQHFESDDEDTKFFYEKFYKYIRNINTLLPKDLPKEKFVHLRYSTAMIHNSKIYKGYITKIGEINDHDYTIAAQIYNDKLFTALNTFWQDNDIVKQLFIFMG